MSDAFALPQPMRPRLPSWGTLASLGVHLAFALALFWVSPLRPMVAPPPRPVAVEIVTEQQFAAITTPTAAAQNPAPAEPRADTVTPPATISTPPASSPAGAAKADRGVVTATQFYAAGLLREPGMEKIRATMGTLDPGERVVQLCNIEGLEQIRRAERSFDPDTLVPYAMADMTGSGLALSATGGAFRSRRKWYGIAFDCKVAADYSGVTAFSFKLGAPIPENEWEEHNLNAEDADE